MRRVINTLSGITSLVRRQIYLSAKFHMATVLKLTEPVPLAEEVQSAAESLQNGHIIAVPTDTIYGIAGLAQNIDAVNRIYNIKRRDAKNPIAISVASIDDIYKWSKVTVPRELLTELLPGPVTVVMERSGLLNPHFNPGTPLIGIRIPNSYFIQALSKACDGPIALTSANISATRSTLNIQEFENLWPQLDLVCDGGPLGDTDFSRRGSTVVDLSVPGSYKIIREGSAKKNTVAVLAKYSLEENT